MASNAWRKTYHIPLKVLWVCKNSPFLRILHEDEFSSAPTIPPTFYYVLVMGGLYEKLILHEFGLVSLKEVSMLKVLKSAESQSWYL